MRTQTYHAMQLLVAERDRQIDEEDWPAEHDDQHFQGELALAAGVYALHAGNYFGGNARLAQLSIVQAHFWPWDATWFKPGNYVDPAARHDRRRALVKAGALILAELERLERLGA